MVLSLPVGNGTIESLPLFREPLTLALPKGHPLAVRTAIRREDLAPAVQPEEVKASGLEMLRQLVAAGAGWTLLPVLAASSGTVTGRGDSITLRPLASPEPTRTLGMVWRRNHSRAPSILGLARFLHAHLSDAVEPLPLERIDEQDG